MIVLTPAHITGIGTEAQPRLDFICTNNNTFDDGERSNHGRIQLADCFDVMWLSIPISDEQAVFSAHFQGNLLILSQSSLLCMLKILLSLLSKRIFKLITKLLKIKQMLLILDWLGYSSWAKYGQLYCRKCPHIFWC